MRQPPRFSPTRRDVVKAGLAAGVGAALGPVTGFAAAAAALPPILKTIPSTGEKIPPIGIGTNAFGVTAADELAALREVLRNLPEQGGSLVDTARGYGSSEEVIGQLVSDIGNREKLFIATKTPLSGDVSGGKAVLDESFRRLKVSRIDLLQIHNFVGTDVLMPHFVDYKQAKKIRYIGATTSVDQQYPDMIAAMEKHPLDFIQVDYSIDNRGSAERILPLAQEKGMAVICNVPFGGRRGSVFGKLAGKALPDFAKEFDATTWAQFLLKYIISHPAVTAAIPGTTTLAYLQDNQMAGRGRLPDGAMRRRMEQYWDSL